MALFTDFFPASAGETVEQQVNQTLANNATGVTLTAGITTTATITSGTFDAAYVADVKVLLTHGGSRYTGTVMQVTSPDGLIIILDTPQAIPTGGLTNAMIDLITASGTTVLLGDISVEGDIHGDLIGNSSTSTALATAREFSASGRISAAAVSFDGTGNVDLVTTIVADSITGADLAPAVAGMGLIQEVDGNLSIGPVANSGLTIGADDISVRVGSGLSIDASNNIVVDSLSINDTLAFTSADTFADTDAALAAFVVAFNLGTGATSGGFTVPDNQRVDRGDLLLLTSTIGGVSVVESYIYTGANVTAPANIAAGDFADITHSGQVVESLQVAGANSGLTFNNSVGNVTATVDLADANSNLALGATGLALSNNVDVQGTLDVTGNTTLDANLTVTGSTVNIAADERGLSDTKAINIGSQSRDTSGLSTATETINIGSTAAPAIVNINGGAFVSNGTGTISIDNLADQPINIGTSTGSGVITIGGNSNLMISGSGLTRPTGTETSSLAINAQGQVVTAAGGGAAGFTLLVGTDADITTNSGGDLLVLPIITANRNINFPANPTMGTSFEVSNLSATGAGSGAFRWTLGEANDIVMGSTLTEAFTLDDATASFKMVYTDGMYGWVIIGAN